MTKLDERESIEGKNASSQIQPFAAVLPTHRNNQLCWQVTFPLDQLCHVATRDEAHVATRVSYDRALDLLPGNPYLLANKGLALSSMARYDEAVKWFDKAVQANPKFGAAWANRGLALFKLGRYEEAVACYDKAIAVEPDDPEGWYNKSLALGALGNEKEAKKCFDRVRKAGTTGTKACLQSAILISANSDKFKC